MDKRIMRSYESTAVGSEAREFIPCTLLGCFREEDTFWADEAAAEIISHFQDRYSFTLKPTEGGHAAKGNITMNELGWDYHALLLSRTHPLRARDEGAR